MVLGVLFFWTVSAYALEITIDIPDDVVAQIQAKKDYDERLMEAEAMRDGKTSGKIAIEQYIELLIRQVLFTPCVQLESQKAEQEKSIILSTRIRELQEKAKSIKITVKEKEEI